MTRFIPVLEEWGTVLLDTTFQYRVRAPRKRNRPNILCYLRACPAFQIHQSSPPSFDLTSGLFFLPNYYIFLNLHYDRPPQKTELFSEYAQQTGSKIQNVHPPTWIWSHPPSSHRNYHSYKCDCPKSISAFFFVHSNTRYAVAGKWRRKKLHSHPFP